MVLNVESGHVFLNDTLHFTAYNSDEHTQENKTLLIVRVDMEGDTWGTIRMPQEIEFSISGQSQGRFYGMQIDRMIVGYQFGFLKEIGRAHV